ncbi:hypothetical protein EV175_000362 [Coemansia sp. RSA 1933]|nr:hypothetical protein EV175_000362 [Coemansia sp. RSA 1933]
MTTSRSGNDSDLGGASDAGRHKRDIPIAPRDKDVRRTVFMRTITESNIYSDVIKQWFSEFGEVADVCNLTGRSGICYVMFYDSRCAQSVLERAGGYISIGNANLTLQPSRHRPDAIGRNPNPDDYQGSVLLSIEGSHVLRGFAESDMKKFEEYGEVCDFYSYDGLQNEWIVEYYDVRAAHEAILACHGMPFLGGTMNRGGYAPEAVAAHVRSGNVAMPENDAEAGGSPEGTGQQHAPNSTSGGGGGGGMAANDRMDVLTKLTLDPSLLRKAQAAKEILQQHKGSGCKHEK